MILQLYLCFLILQVYSNPCFDLLANISILPSNPNFSTYAFIKNPLYNSTPSFVVLPKTISEVQTSVVCAFQNNLKISIKSGGHSFAGYSTIGSPGFMINMDKMKNITWSSSSDPAIKIVTVQTGSRWHDVYQAFRDHGGLWVVTGGLCPSVGVAGFTLGGGVGPCGRKFGLAVDNVVSFTMVTANGTNVIKANSEENSDLYWALRGSGGGNFGIVTDISFKVHEGPKIQSWGTICYDKDKRTITNALYNLGKLERMLPDSINVDVILDNDEGLCFWVVFLGPKKEALNLLSPIINYKYAVPKSINITEYNCWWEMIEDFALAHGYPKDDQGGNEPFLMKNGFIEDLSFEAAESIANFDIPDTCDQHLIHFGGIINRVERNSTAFYWRNARYMVYLSCGWSNANEESISLEFMEKWWISMKNYFKGSYINFIDRNLDNWKDRYYGKNFERLLKIKKDWNDANNGGPLHFEQEIDA